MLKISKKILKLLIKISKESHVSKISTKYFTVFYNISESIYIDER